MAEIRVHPEVDHPSTGSRGDDASGEVAAIRADIEQTRVRMSHTVETLGERLNPDRVKQRIKNDIHDATIGKAEHMARVAVDRVDETRHSIMDNIRENPIPAAMVGIGLGWLFLNGRRDEHRTFESHRREPSDLYPGYDSPDRHSLYQHGRFDQAAEGTSGLGDRAREKVDDLAHRGEELVSQAQDRVTGIAHDARDTVGDAADRAQEAIGHTADRARHMASDVAHQTRHGARWVEDRVDHALHDSPLAVGAAAVAFGLALGLSAPASRREAELMGSTRDRLVDRARDAAEEATDRVRHAAGRLADETRDTVREVAREEGLS